MNNYLVHIFLTTLTFAVGFFSQNYFIISLSLIYLFWYSFYTKQWKNIIIFTLLIIPIIIISYFWKSTIDNSTFHKAEVIKISDNSLIVSKNKNLYYIYHESTKLFKRGDIITFNSTFSIPDDKWFYMFLRSNGTEFSGFANNIEIVENGRNSWRNNLYESILNDDSYFSSFSSFMFYGQSEFSDISKDISNSVNRLGINHLFVVSGFHITFLFNIVYKLSRKIIKWNNFIPTFLSFSSALIFVYLIFFPRSSIRAIIYKMFSLSTKQNNISSLSLTGMIFLVFNPYSLFTISMILSFGISFFILIIFNMKIKRIWKLILIPIGAFSIATPFINTFNNEINLLSPLHTIIFTPVISLTYIFTILVLPIKNIWFLIEPIAFMTVFLIELLSNFTILIEVSIKSMIGAVFILSSTFYFLNTLKDSPLLILTSLCTNIFLISLI